MLHKITIEGVASEIGALGGKEFKVLKKDLISGLCYRFTATVEEVELAIKEAIEVDAIVENGDYIYLVLDD